MPDSPLDHATLNPATLNPATLNPATLNQVTIRTSVDIPIRGGRFTATFISFVGLADGKEHLALRLGQPDPVAPLVRLHSECMTGDLFGSQLCDCGPQLDEALARCAAEGGYVLYLRQEGRGIGLYAKLDAYLLQEKWHVDTFEANHQLHYPDDLRDYGVAAQMLRALDVGAIRLLTNNPDKVSQLQAAGIAVVERVPTGVFVNPRNIFYLRTKAAHAGHALAPQALAPQALAPQALAAQAPAETLPP